MRKNIYKINSIYTLRTILNFLSVVERYPTDGNFVYSESKRFSYLLVSIVCSVSLISAHVENLFEMRSQWRAVTKNDLDESWTLVQSLSMYSNNVFLTVLIVRKTGGFHAAFVDLKRLLVELEISDNNKFTGSFRFNVVYISSYAFLVASVYFLRIDFFNRIVLTDHLLRVLIDLKSHYCFEMFNNIDLNQLISVKNIRFRLERCASEHDRAVRHFTLSSVFNLKTRNVFALAVLICFLGYVQNLFLCVYICYIQLAESTKSKTVFLTFAVFLLIICHSLVRASITSHRLRTEVNIF